MNNDCRERMARRLVAALLVLVFIPIPNMKAQDRLPPIPPEKMSDAQKKAVADYKNLRKTDPAAPPWSVILRVPDWLIPALQMRLHVVNQPVLGNKLSELVILMAARDWTNNYEWNGHSSAAIRAGLNPDIIAAVADGRRPQRMAADEEIVYDLCNELLHNRSVSDPTYARALQRFGEAGVVEAASIAGYYVYLAMVMNTARSPLSGGAKPQLTPFPK